MVMEPEITPEGTSLLDRVALSFADDLERLAQAAAAEQGQPIGTRKASHAEAVKQWGINDPQVEDNYDAFLDMLKTTGLPPEMLDPESPQCLMVIKEDPDLAQWYGQPIADPALAARYATLAEWPFRRGLLMDEDDPDEQVRLANAYDRDWERSLLGDDVAATPVAGDVEPTQQAPAAPMPSMIGG